MDSLDAPTLLQVSALFNVLAAGAWLLLAQLFRIAPRASRWMAAAHGMRLVSEAGGDGLVGVPALLHPAVSAFSLLASMVLLLMALRRMLRSRQHARDVAGVAAAAAGAIAAGLVGGSAWVPQAASTAGVTLLAALAVGELRRGIGGQVSVFIGACMILPFIALAGVGGVHTAELVLAAQGGGLLPAGLSAPARAALSFLLTTSITLSLFALMIWRLISRIQHLTHRDPLTGALNRRAFEQALVDAQAQLQRGHGFAVVMIDIDHFKRINDQHGHAAGDAALKHCVQLWRAGLREVDRLGRLGGEEFGALLPLATPGDLASAAAVVERLRDSLARQPLRWAGQSLRLSASFGVALPVTGDPRGDVGLARADAELYRAKAEGRNRVCVATHLAAVAP